MLPICYLEDFLVFSKLSKLVGFPGAPEETRTPNLLIRSQMLYPIELRAHVHKFLLKRI